MQPDDVKTVCTAPILPPVRRRCLLELSSCLHDEATTWRPNHGRIYVYRAVVPHSPALTALAEVISELGINVDGARVLRPHSFDFLRLDHFCFSSLNDYTRSVIRIPCNLSYINDRTI